MYQTYARTDSKAFRWGRGAHDSTTVRTAQTKKPKLKSTKNYGTNTRGSHMPKKEAQTVTVTLLPSPWSWYANGIE